MSKGIIRNVIMVIVFIVCLALIIIGQKNISAAGLGMELILSLIHISEPTSYC